MSRLARRRSDPVPLPRPSRTRLLRAIWPWVAPALSLVIATALVFWLEGSGLWSPLRTGIQALDFDPSRAALILAWLAGIVLAIVATLLGGRPWLAALAATVFVAVTYAWPLGERLRQEVPTIFGLKEQLQPGVVWHNQLVALAITLLAALIGAATADLIRRGAINTGVMMWRTVRSHRLELLPLSTLAGTGAVCLALVISLLLAGGVDAVLRYGPEHGVYLMPVTPSPPVSVDPAHPSAAPEPIPSHGELREQVYRSAAMGTDRHFLVYLPPTYGLKSAATRRYPVLYLLHGDPGGPSQWVQYGAPSVLDTGEATRALPETILVMPDGSGHLTAATQWADRFDGRDRVEDALLELTEIVDLDFRTIPDRAHRLIGGLSSGAFGATNIAARHPDLFGTAMSFSGYFLATGPVFGSDARYARYNSPYYLVQDNAAARTVRYILIVGSRDPYYLKLNRAFADQLARLGVPHSLDLLAGGHSAEIWQGGLALGMTRVAQDLSVPVRLPDGGKTHGIQY